MRIQAKDLPQHLKRGLSNCYFVFGDEPLQHTETLDTIRATAKQKGYTEREIFQITPNFEWASLLSSVNTPSLFAEKRLIECRVGESKIGKGIADTLAKLATLPLSASIVFLLSAAKLDTKIQQSKGFLALEQKGITISARALSAKEALGWIEHRLSAAGFKTTPESIQLLFERTEGNLLAASQVIDKLKLCFDPQQTSMLSTENIRDIVGMDARFTIYDLVDTALSGSIERTTRVFSSLKNEGIEPILMLWAITKEIRMVLALFSKIKNQPLSSDLLSQNGVWKHRESLIRSFINRTSVPQLQTLLIQSKHVDDIIKGRSPGSAWTLLFSICLALANPTTLILENI
jgi:DNA polymerase-3 subunit delta